MNNRNTTEYWNTSWSMGVKKFPKYTMRKIKELIPERSSVLDIGCGYGKLLVELRRDKQCDIYGVDISDVAIKDMRTRLNIDGEVGDAEDFKLSIDRKFDVIIIAHLLEHLDNDYELLKRCRNYLKLGGILLVAVPDNCSYPEETGEHVRKYTKQSLTELLLKLYSTVDDFSIRII